MKKRGFEVKKSFAKTGVAAVLVLGMLLAACGGSSNGGNAGDSGKTSAVTESAGTTSAAKAEDTAKASTASEAEPQAEAPAAAASVDVEALADRLAADISYDDTLDPIEDGMLEIIFSDIKEADLAAYKIWLSSGSTAEEVAVFEANDEAAADAVYAALEKRISEQKNSFENYVPAEVDRLESGAVLEKQGTVVAFNVSGDPDAAKKIINEAFGK